MTTTFKLDLSKCQGEKACQTTKSNVTYIISNVTVLTPDTHTHTHTPTALSEPRKLSVKKVRRK